MECHELIDDMERECLKSHGVHLVIHYDPVVTDDPELDRMHIRVEQILHTLDLRLGVHDFRMVPGKEHTNLIFDALVPADTKASDQELAKQIAALVHETWPSYYAVVDIDRSFV